jgi:hypothetical protein
VNSESKRALRQYYHEQLAPASDVDLFIYGLNEEQAIEKIKEIETKVSVTTSLQRWPGGTGVLLLHSYGRAAKGCVYLEVPYITKDGQVRDSILQETTTIRTKNAITIASAYPTRHIQIVLRLYKSISEILTGFDVDCSCVAYDGSMVWATPRAIASYITQIK